MRTKNEVLESWKVTGGQLTAAWATVGNLLIESIEHHFADGNGDCSLTGYGYNKLLQADHRTMAAALKNAALKCACIVFKKDEEREGKYIAKKATGKLFEEHQAGMHENMELLRKEGLKAFKPEKKESAGKSKAALAVSAMDKLNDVIAKGDKQEIAALQSELLILMAAFTRLCQVGGYGTPGALFAKFTAPAKGREDTVRHDVAPTAAEFEAARKQDDKGGIVGYNVGDVVIHGDDIGTIIAMHDTTVIVRDDSGSLKEWKTSELVEKELAAA